MSGESCRRAAGGTVLRRIRYRRFSHGCCRYPIENLEWDVAEALDTPAGVDRKWIASRIQERTRAGLEAAHARGRKGGRPKWLNVQQRALALDLYTQRKHTVEEICRTLGISKPTLYAYVRGASSSSKP
ncbi:MAG: recombinase family protein [Planctomycetaceae bacterium]|nr:recombinase family protein [Planctomycetaceae bacterium]